MKLPFQDRREAGRLLGLELVKRRPPSNTIVLALPRGGVQVAAEVADVLKAPLDLIVVRKLGVPWQPELAMGAMAGATRILDTELIRDLRISERDIEAVIAREREEMHRREKLYRAGAPEPNLHGRCVVLIDDGIATGATMIAAARSVRCRHPRSLIIAAPVASEQAKDRLQTEADECVFLALPQPFFGVGQWYKDFRQLTDAEVQQILKENRVIPLL